MGSAYDEATRFASADALRAERMKASASDADDLRVVEEYVRFMKLSLMVRVCVVIFDAHAVLATCLTYRRTYVTLSFAS